MKKIIIMVLFVSLFWFINPSYAQSPITPLAERSVPEIVEFFANQYSVPAEKMLSTMKCESRLDKNAIGDHGQSYGLAQIYLPAHRNITKAQALDAVFASEYMAKEFSSGHQKQWTCYRILYT